MKLELSVFLGRPAGELLATAPFCDWPVVISNDAELDLVHHCFEQHGLELQSENSEVTAIFVESSLFDLVSLPSLHRAGLLDAWGSPDSSGEAIHDEELGRFGAWDRFDTDSECVHIEYQYSNFDVHKITIMSPSIAPQRQR